MDRRSFFSSTAAVGAGAAIPLLGCSATPHPGSVGTFTEAEAAAVIADLRRSLDATADLRFASRLVPASRVDADPDLRRRLDHADALADKGIHALLIADAGGRLRDGSGGNDRFAPYFADFAPMLDDAVIEHTALLARAPVLEKHRVSERLRRDPDLPMRLGEALDTHARALGASADGRGKMRRILSDVAARSRVQPFSAVADEYVEKVQRVAAQRGETAAFARAIATSASAAALWAPVAAATAATTPTGTPARAPEPVRSGLHGSARTIRDGLVTGGIGLGVFGLGAFMAAAAGGGIMNGGAVVAGVIIATVGAVAVLVSLIMLLVGAIQSAVE